MKFLHFGIIEEVDIFDDKSFAISNLEFSSPLAETCDETAQLWRSNEQLKHAKTHAVSRVKSLNDFQIEGADVNALQVGYPSIELIPMRQSFIVNTHGNRIYLEERKDQYLPTSSDFKAFCFSVNNSIISYLQQIFKHFFQLWQVPMKVDDEVHCLFPLDPSDIGQDRSKLRGDLTVAWLWLTMVFV